MAKVQTEIIVIKLSKLIKDTENETSLTSKDLENNLEDVVQELVGESILVEIERGN